MHNINVSFELLGKTGFVHFSLEQKRNLSPSELPEFLPKSDFFRQAEEIVLEGKGPNWLYAFLAYCSVREKVKLITVRTLDKGDVTVYRAGQSLESRAAASWYSLEPEENGFRCKIAGHSQCPVEVLSCEVLSFPPSCPCLKITGSGALWMYAALSAAAADAGISEVLIDNPNLFGLVSIGVKNPGRLF